MGREGKRNVQKARGIDLQKTGDRHKQTLVLCMNVCLCECHILELQAVMSCYVENRLGTVLTVPSLALGGLH